MASKRDYSNVTIKHVMADGSVRDSLADYHISVADLPPVVAGIMRNILMQPPKDKKVLESQ